MIRIKYAVALRAIGQDLDRRSLKSFDLRCEGDEYIVQCGYQSPPSELPVTIRYTVKDIHELDDIGKTERGKVEAPKDFLNQIQILRTIGGYLDKVDARLLGITNNESLGAESAFKVEYINSDGERVVDDRTGLAIYDMCVGMYKQRGRLTGTGGRC